jgi:DNA-binding MarR family transcriptional regulator
MSDETSINGGGGRAFTGPQELIGLTPGNLVTHLRKLEDAGYVTTHKNGSGVTARTSVELTHSGRAALDQYTAVLRGLLDSANGSAPSADS